MLMIYLLLGYPAWTWEYTAAFVSTPRESPSNPRVVWGSAGTPPGKIPSKWGWVSEIWWKKHPKIEKNWDGGCISSAAGIFEHTFPGFFPDPPGFKRKKILQIILKGTKMRSNWMRWSHNFRSVTWRRSIPLSAMASVNDWLQYPTSNTMEFPI